MSNSSFLGSNYKWWFAIKYNVSRVSTGLFGTVLQYISNVITTLAVVYVWYRAGSGSEIITYLTVGRVFQTLSSIGYFGRLASIVENGRITNLLLYPQSFFMIEFANAAGVRVLKNLSGMFGAIIGVIIAGIFFKPIVLPDLKSIILLLLVFVPMAFSIQFFIGVMVGSINFFVNDKRDFDGITQSYMTAFAILTGTIIPLNQLFFTNFFQSLPFAWLLHHPMQIYLGKYDLWQTIGVILGGIIWSVILYFMARFVFKKGLKKNESVGL